MWRNPAATVVYVRPIVRGRRGRLLQIQRKFRRIPENHTGKGRLPGTIPHARIIRSDKLGRRQHSTGGWRKEDNRRPPENVIEHRIKSLAHPRPWWAHFKLRLIPPKALIALWLRAKILPYIRNYRCACCCSRRLLCESSRPKTITS